MLGVREGMTSGGKLTINFSIQSLDAQIALVGVSGYDCSLSFNMEQFLN